MSLPLVEIKKCPLTYSHDLRDPKPWDVNVIQTVLSLIQSLTLSSFLVAKILYGVCDPNLFLTLDSTVVIKFHCQERHVRMFSVRYVYL